jgi:hypothetical protein
MLPSPTAAATRFARLNRTSPHAKTPGTLRLEEIRIAVEHPASAGAHVRAGEHVSVVVEHDLVRKPGRLSIGADEDEQSARLDTGRRARLRVADVDRLEREVAVHGRYLCPERRRMFGRVASRSIS